MYRKPVTNLIWKIHDPKQNKANCSMSILNYTDCSKTIKLTKIHGFSTFLLEKITKFYVTNILCPEPLLIITPLAFSK